MANMFDQFDTAQTPSGAPNMFDKFDDPNYVEPKTGDASRGFKTSMGSEIPLYKGLVGFAGAAAEKAVGEGGFATKLKDWGYEGYRSGMDKLAPLHKDTDEFTNVWDRAKEGDVGALVDFTAYWLGYGAAELLKTGTAAVMGSLAGGAAAGPAGVVPGAAAGAVERGAVMAGARALVERSLSKRIAEGMTEKQAASSLGRDLMVGATNYAKEGGSIYSEAKEQADKEGRELTGADLARVAGGALVAGKIESVADKFEIDRFLKGVTSGTAGLGKRVAIGTGKTALVEGGTEGAQTAVEQVGAGKPLDTTEIINAAAGGAVAGGGIGAVAGAFQRGPAPPPIAAPAPVLPTAGEVTQTIGQARSVDEAIAVAADLVDQGRLITDEKLRATQDFMRAEVERTAALLRAQEFDAAAAQTAGPGGAVPPLSADAVFAQREQALTDQKAIDAQRLADIEQGVTALRDSLPAENAGSLGAAERVRSTSGTSEGPIVDSASASQASDPSGTTVGAAMQGMLDRITTKLQADPTRATTSELAFLAQHATDPAVQSRAAEVANARRNAAVFTDAVRAQPLALPAPDTTPRGPGTVFVASSGEAGRSLPAVEQRAAINRNAPQLTAEGQAALGQQRAAMTQAGFDPLDATSPLDMSTARTGRRAADSVLVEPPAPVDQAVVTDLNAGLQVDEPTAAVRAVSVEQLPENRHTHEDGSVTLSRTEARDIQNLTRVYGKEVVFVEDVHGNAPEGAVVDSDDQHVFVAVRSKAAHQLVVATHEIAHHLERDAPDLHAKLVEGLVGRDHAVTEDSPLVEFYRYYHNKPGMEGRKIVERLSNPEVQNKLIREFVADIFGNRHAELKTHQMLFNAAKRANDPSLIHRIANFIVGYIDRLLARVKLKKFGTDNLVRDLQRTRKLVREVAMEYAVRQGRTRLQAQVDMIEASRKPASALASAPTAPTAQRDVDRNGFPVFRSPKRGAVPPAAKATAPETTATDETLLQNQQLDLHLLNVDRAERFADARGVKLSSAEETAIEKAATEFDIPAERIRATVLAYKADHPVSQGWGEPVFAGLAKNGKTGVKYRYETQPYTFSDNTKGRALDPLSPEYHQRVNDIADKMVAEMRTIYQRMQQGDENARTMIRQAGWYSNMRVRLRQEFGGLADLFVDSLGATSPKTPVRDNWTQSVEILRRASRGDYDTIIAGLEAWITENEQFNAEFKAWFDERRAEGMTKKDIQASTEYKEAMRTARELRELPQALEPLKESGARFNTNTGNVVRALVNMWRTIKAENPDIAVRGTAPKAINFSGNLIGYRERATIDMWAARMLQRLAGGTRAPAMAEDGVSGTMLPSGKTTLQFGFGQDVFQQAAERIRNDPELAQNPILQRMNDDDLQAVVWFSEKEIWTKNNWTSVLGEGGSFEAEASLTGAQDQSRIRELRRIIDSTKTKAADRLAALEELKTFQRPVDRYMGGLSIQQAADTQGVDYVPDNPAMARLARAVKNAIYAADDGLTVLGAKVLSTVGRYGGEERSLDFEVVARENFNALPLMQELLEQAQTARQDSMFLSRVLPQEQKYDPLVHRPGIEIYFKEQTGLARAEPLLKQLATAGVDMYTVIVDGRRSSSVLAGEMPGVVGVRFQYVPEFEVRYGGEIPASDSEIQSRIETQRKRLADLAETLLGLPDVSFAGQFWYETDVRFQHEYQGAIDEIANRRAEGLDRVPGKQVWSGRKIREALEAAARQRRAAGGGGQETAPAGGDASAAGLQRAEGRPGIQRSTARGPADAGDAGSDGRGDQRGRTPSVDEAGRVTLDHWSHEAGLKALDPSYHGKGLRGAESKRKRDDPANWVNRTYFGIRGGGYEKEAGLGGHHYEVELPLEALYDFKKDPDKLYPAKVSGWDIAESVYERKIKEAGYAGYWVDNSSLGMVAAVYIPTVPTSMLSPEISASQRRAATANPVFKKWFGRSRIVDANGVPEVWYHGTARDITEFKPKQANAIFVTRNPQFAEGFAGMSEGWINTNETPQITPAREAELRRQAERIVEDEGVSRRSKLFEQRVFEEYEMLSLAEIEATSPAARNLIPLFVKAENPFDYKKPSHVLALVDKLFGDEDTATLITAGSHGAAVMVDRDELVADLGRGFWPYIEAAQVQEALRALGHDGFYVRESGFKNLAVYHSNQLKSVFNEAPTAAPRIDRSEQRAAYLGALTPDQEEALRKAGAITQPLTVRQQMQSWKANLGLRMAQGMVDQFRAIKDVDPQAYLLARMSKGTDGMLEAMFLFGKPFLRDGIGDVRVNPNGGFARVLANLDGEHGRFSWWVAALRAERLKAEGRENLLTDADISALKTLNTDDAQHPERAKKFRDALDQLNDYNKAVLNIARESGLIDDEAFDLMKDQPYVPFYRAMKDGVSGPSFGSGLTRQYFAKKLKGGKEALNQDLLQNMLLNWSHVFEASAKNRAAKAALDAAVNLGVAYPVTSGTKGSTTVRENGVERAYTVEDPYLFEAIGAVNYASPSWYKPFSVFKRWLTVGVTANPAFKIRNLIRDSVQAIGTSELGFNPFGNVKQGFMATDRQSQTYASMLAGGGMMRFGTIENSDHANALVKKHLKDAMILDESGFKKLTGQMGELWELYSEFGDRLENVNRAALYDQLIAKGKSHAEASFMSRDLMDFSMSGRWPVVRFLAQSVPFMNARMQGLYKLGRAATEDPRKLGVTTAAVVMASMALLFAYGDDEDWKKREDWDRDNYWWFKIGDTAVRIPKPFELGAVGTLVERTWELGFDREMNLKRYGKQIAGLFFEQFSMSPIPQLAKPFWDVYANQDSFTGRPIESQGMERLRPEDRARAGTSTVARFLGQLGLPDPGQLAMGRYSALSPVQVDYLIRGYAGWVGATATAAMDYGMRPLQDRGERPEMRLKDVFVLGSFVESLPAGSSRYVTQMYEEARQASQAYASWREAIKAGDVTQAREIAVTEREKLARYRSLDRTSDRLGELNTQIKRIEESKTLSAQTKRRMIDSLREQQDRMARAAVRNQQP